MVSAVAVTGHTLKSTELRVNALSVIAKKSKTRRGSRKGRAPNRPPRKGRAPNRPPREDAPPCTSADGQPAAPRLAKTPLAPSHGSRVVQCAQNDPFATYALPLSPQHALAAGVALECDDRDRRWDVASLVYGEGVTGLGGATEMPCAVHASQQRVALPNSFWPVELEAVLFADLGDTEIVMETYALRDSSADRRLQLSTDTCPACVIPARRTRESRGAQIMRHVMIFLKSNPGVVVMVSGIGARPAVVWPEGSLVHTLGQPWAKSKHLDCLRAAAANAAFACGGHVAAEALAPVLEADGRVAYRFRALGGMYRRAGERQSGVHCARVKQIQRAIQSRCGEAAFEALASAKTGVFIVRLLAGTAVDHAVVVDATRGIIVDSEEDSTIALSATNLRRCAGSKTKQVRVVEVREVRRSRREMKW